MQNIDSTVAAVHPFEALNLAAVTESGDYGADCLAGRDQAARALNYMNANSCPTMLGHLVEAMIARGRFSGLEVGFFQAISERATV